MSMKTNKFLRIASVLLIAVLLTTCVISGTFAKYISSATGSDTATVAKWSFQVSDEEIAVTGNDAEVAFDLFTTIKDTAGAAEDDVAASKKIAPGTTGSFGLKVQNTSEVTAKYTIALTEVNNSNIPLQYSVDGTTWKDSIAELSLAALTDKELAIGAEAVTHTVYWKWVFDGASADAPVHADQTDVTDTALGIAAQGTAPQVSITATITATQVD